MADARTATPERLAARKADLRARMRDLRRAIAPDERAALGRLVADRLAALPEIDGARVFLLFSSFGSEVPTAPIIEQVAGAGRTILLPYLEGGRMAAAAVDPREVLVATAYGPGEPPRRVPMDPSSIDAVVLPGLAFDRHGHRLGYGGGHYDRYVGGLRAEALRVGICFHDQVVDEVPHGPGDERVHIVLTDREVVDCREPGSG
jgi:5-formyltetrahydrofolate cyclo-ligase